MNLKRRFTIHLDAVVVIAVLFISSLGFNYFQSKQVQELGWQVFRQDLKLLENDMNLSSQKHYIEKLESKCEENSVVKSSSD